MLTTKEKEATTDIYVLTQFLQVLKAGWNGTRQIVPVQEQNVQIGQVAQVFWNGSLQFILVQIQQDHLAQSTQKGWDDSSPLGGLQREFLQRGHAFQPVGDRTCVKLVVGKEQISHIRQKSNLGGDISSEGILRNIQMIKLAQLVDGGR